MLRGMYAELWVNPRDRGQRLPMDKEGGGLVPLKGKWSTVSERMEAWQEEPQNSCLLTKPVPADCKVRGVRRHLSTASMSFMRKVI